MATSVFRSILWACASLVFWSSFSSDGATQNSDVSKMQAINPRMPGPLVIDQERVKAAGIRIIRGAHVDVYTDVRDQPEIDEMAKLFDLAIPQWCQRFGIDPEKTKHYRLSAFIFTKLQEDLFRQAGLMPDDLPEFPAGYNRGHELWVYLQPDVYYTRHLVLHEGTHAFMQWFLGGSGPPWYSEGMAELLGLHQWKDGKLTIGRLIRDPKNSMGWGRIRIIQNEHLNNSSKTLDQATNIDYSVFRGRHLLGYSWAWAACEFLSKHPATADSFPEFAKLAGRADSDFNRAFQAWLDQHRQSLEIDWDLFCQEIDYGYEVARASIQNASKNASGQFEIEATKNWQRTDILVSHGDRLTVTARGRFTVAQQLGETWPSEANGITIDYYRGKPLGILVLAILPDDLTVDSLMNPIAVGTSSKLTAPISGTVCFRINESPAKMYDNDGRLTVSIKKN